MTKSQQTNHDYYILGELPPEERLENPPAEYWVLHLYIIVLEQEVANRASFFNTGKFLVLEHLADQGRGFWTTPYLGHKLDVGTRTFDKVSAITEMYEEEIKNASGVLQMLDENRFYHMGFSPGIKGVVPGEKYIEYKRSPRNSGVWKCYFIKEYFLSDFNSLGLKNLSNPENRHIYHHLPVNVNTTHTGFFCGVPLLANVSRLFDGNYLLNNARVERVNVEAVFHTKRRGYMLKFDLTSSTETLHEIKASLRTFEHSGSHFSGEFILRLKHIFEEELMKIDVWHYRFEGDGFIATMEIESYDCNATKRVIDALKNISKRITKLLEDANIKSANKVSYRASVMFGDYNYGRGLGLSSKNLVHFGEELIRLTRMDSYIRAHINRRKKTVSSIFFLIDSKLCTENKFADNNKISCIAKKAKTFRNIAIDGVLYSIKMEEIS